MNDSAMRQWQNILILGAGELGMAMLAGFIRQRQQRPALRLSVLLRPASLTDPHPANQARLQQLAEWGVKVITADFSQQTTGELSHCFAPFDAIINCSGFVGGAGTQLKITRAVLDAGVARYFPWQFGVDYDQIGKDSGQPVWDEQLAVREILRAQQQTQWVIVSTGMFTSYLFEPSFGIVDGQQQRVYAPGAADYALTLTTPEDIGWLTAQIFCHQPVIKNSVVYIAGDTLTYHQLTSVLSEHYGVPFTLQVLSHQQLHDAVAAAPGDLAAAYRLAFARAEGVAWKKADSFNARYDIDVTDVAQWLADNHPALNQPIAP
ncbi:aromatic alcohol reductase [Erwiniaceae bacterium BAC15a-03b]|uniref:Aromatic alcohol reductase n=1 Tax=Winslowiella arboricola TaxID=2978220 RepID=A0A9J6PYY8_9GAMM|nr:aromatic alcohol reductase [Winslowiella arboricola]MCU5773321.1 aromatic alcohol reductase [Winslowiella arboricola]MCU5779207.1 aromatic alcohol reductase [Winslowiella arboricola]